MLANSLSGLESGGQRGVFLVLVWRKGDVSEVGRSMLELLLDMELKEVQK